MPRAIFPIIGLLLTTAPTLAASPTPAAFGDAFCRASLDGDMSPIEQSLSDSLSVIVMDAWAKNDALQTDAPEEKPPLGDGLPWRSWQDTPMAAISMSSKAQRNPLESKSNIASQPIPAPTMPIVWTSSKPLTAGCWTTSNMTPETLCAVLWQRPLPISPQIKLRQRAADITFAIDLIK